MKNLRKMAKIFYDVIIFFIILLVVIIMFNFFQVNILNKKYPDFFGYTFFEVTTGSMKETIQINDVILVKITKDVYKDDIISYQNKDEIITHRIIKETEEELITKGDANNTIDKPIKRENVIGKVIKIFPELGIWIKVFSDLKVALSIIITITLFSLALTNKNKAENKKSRHSFSKFIKNVKGIIKNAKKKKKTKD